MAPENIFLLVWFIVMVCLVSFFIINGKRALKKFPKLKNSEFEFIEYMASGYSTQSFKTKMGGAKNVLRIRVTKDQIWLTTNSLMAFIAEQFDLLHLIPIESITGISVEKKKINLEFLNNGRTKKGSYNK